MQIFLFFALLIAILAILFAVQNNDLTSVSFIAWDFNGSLALVLLIALAVGALVSFLFSLPSNLKARWTIRNQRKRLSDLEGQISDNEAELEQAQKTIDDQNLTIQAFKQPQIVEQVASTASEVELNKEDIEENKE